jgi:hypothetical protein
MMRLSVWQDDLMKNVFLISVLFLITGCGGPARQQVEIPANTDIRADIAFKTEEGGQRVDVIFYFSTPVAPGVKTSPPQQTVPVEDPRVNDQPLTEATSETGTPHYTSTTVNSLPSNVISARINGRLYEGRTVPGSTIRNKQMAVTLVPK